MTREIVVEDGVAIGGYDPVAYFTEGAAVLGHPEHAHRWNGAEWQFASEENRQAFEADPDRYAPQFGGHCALAASLGRRAAGSPESWAIEEGKLYFNKSGAAGLLWKLIPGRVAAGHEKWARP